MKHYECRGETHWMNEVLRWTKERGKHQREGMK